MNLAPMIRQRFFDANGNPLAGGKLHTYQAGTSTPQPTYTDSTGGTPNTNPVVLDANGEANVWLDPELSYKFILTDANDNQLWSVDGVVALLNEDSVVTRSIQDGAVTEPKLADDAVSARALASSADTDGDRSVDTDHIKNLAVTTPKIANAAVTAEKLADGLIEGLIDDETLEVDDGTLQVKDGGITNEKLMNPNSVLVCNTANGNGSTADRIRRFSNIVTSIGDAITRNASSTLGDTFTINKSGLYFVSYTDHAGSNASAIGISVNATSPWPNINTVTYANGCRGFIYAPSTTYSTYSVTLHLNAGDVLRAHHDNTLGSGGTMSTFAVIQLVGS